MVNTLRVMLWDEEIGRLAWDNRRRLSYFTYNPEFLKRELMFLLFKLLCVVFVQ